MCFCWRSRDELIRDVLLWIPTHGRAKAGRPARTYIQQLCEDTGCCPEDLPRAMNDKEEWRERVRDIRANSAIWWWWPFESITTKFINFLTYYVPPKRAELYEINKLKTVRIRNHSDADITKTLDTFLLKQILISKTKIQRESETAKKENLPLLFELMSPNFNFYVTFFTKSVWDDFLFN